MRKTLILIFLFSASILVHGQLVFEPLHKDVYAYLSRIAQRGVIVFNDEIRPVSRKYIVEKLTELEYRKNKLTNIEAEELEFYKQDYYTELNYTGEYDLKGLPTSFGKDNGGRYRLFSYFSNDFAVNVSPIFGYEMGSNDGIKNTRQWSGLGFYGYISKSIGFSFDYRDNNETGENIDTKKIFSPETGTTLANLKENSVDYSEVHTMVGVDWDWGSASIGKDFLEWGYGKSGQIVLSQKAPSFPFFRLDIKPLSWIRFNYMHGFLNSNVIDSTASYPTSLPNDTRIVWRNKYIASHTLTITPSYGLDISLGESVVYADKLEPLYLMPLMFFRLADHYLSKSSNNAGANSQFFLQISSRNHLPNTHLYGSLFIDEIYLGGLFNPEKERNQLGFSLGFSVTDLPLPNLTFTGEYTKIYPYAYSHYVPTTTYTNDGYNLGHWMGNNGDLMYGAIEYRIIRGLQVKAWGEFIRKGSPQPLTIQYSGSPQPPFLSGDRTNYTYFGFDVKYEITHELFAKGIFQKSTTSVKQPSTLWVDTDVTEFYFSLYYGL